MSIMTESTKAMYAKILAEAQAKANGKTQVISKATPAPKTEVTPVNKPIPTPAVKTPVIASPEMSNVTFADLMNSTPEVKPAAPATDQKIIGDFTFIAYSAASFAVKGPTYPIKSKMHDFGGKWNRNLKCGEAWIFPVKKYYIVRSFIERLQATA